MVRILGIAALVILALIAAAAFVLPGLIPEDVYRARITETASATLGRDIAIAGDIRVATFPTIQARAGDVTIANEEGFSAPAFAEVGELRATLALLPLLSRRVEIKEFVLERPQIALEVDRAGRNNWTFRSDGATAASGGGAFKRQPGALPFDAALGDVRIEDGAARYVDRAAGTEHAIDGINLALAMPGLDRPLTVDGGFALDGAPVTIKARLDSLRAFFDGAAAPFALDLNAGALEVSADGGFEAGEDVRFAGDVTVRSDDLRALAAQADAALPEGDVYERFLLRGRASGDASRLAFENAHLEFDAIAGDGGVTLNLAGAKPALSGALALGDVDVTPYLPANAGDNAGASGGVAPWSEEPIDLAPLRAVDADFTLTVRSLKARAFEFGRSDVTARLRDGRLQIDLSELQAYEGSGTAQVVVNANGAVPSYALSADLANIQAQPFLQAAARFSRLTGAGAGRLSLTAQGRSQAEIMRSLDGSGGFDFTDGALRGVNVAAALRGIEGALQGDLNLDAFRSNATTDFTDFIGQFAIEDGVARVRDFRMSSPLFRMTGSGALNIAEQSLDLHLEPRAVASAQGQGGAANLNGLGVPLRVSGSWGAVTAGIDSAALENALAQRAQDELVNAVGGDVGGLLRDVIGGGSGGDASASDDEPATDANAEDGEAEDDPAERLLQGLFGAIGGGDDDEGDGDGGDR